MGVILNSAPSLRQIASALKSESLIFRERLLMFINLKKFTFVSESVKWGYNTSLCVPNAVLWVKNTHRSTSTSGSLAGVVLIPEYF